MMDHFLNMVDCSDALRILRALPSASIDTIACDPMHGKRGRITHDWGNAHAMGKQPDNMIDVSSADMINRRPEEI